MGRRNVFCFIAVDLQENHRDARVAGFPPGGTYSYNQPPALLLLVHAFGWSWTVVISSIECD